MLLGCGDGRDHLLGALIGRGVHKTTFFSIHQLLLLFGNLSTDSFCSLVRQGERLRHGGNRHHLNEDLLCILEAFEQRLVSLLEVHIVLCAQRHLLHLLL